MAPLINKNFNLTVKKALAIDKEEVSKSICSEFKQMDQLKVFEPLQPSERPTPGADLLPSLCTIKQKAGTNGAPTKWKSRFVAGGHRQTDASYTATSSPTMSITSLYILCNLLLEKDMQVATADVVGAYLNAEMTDEVFMRIDKRLVPYMVESNPQHKKMIRPNGEIFVKLKKALYGCRQSGRLWYDKISNILSSIGFTKSRFDECVFTLRRQGQRPIIIGLYVDDLWIMSHNNEDEKWIIDQLKSKVNGMTINHGDSIDYLGMNFNFKVKDEISVTAKGYTDEVLRLHQTTGTVISPANDDIFKVNDNLPLLNDHQQGQMRSSVHKLLYLASRTRPDISVPVNFLCTRVLNYTLEDKFKLNRVLKYLNGTKNLGLRFTKRGSIDIKVYADASHGSHADGKGHSGLLITLNDGPILFKSSKQKITTLSSSESELVCLSDSVPSICGILDFLNEMKAKVTSKVIFQDNMSTIQMVKNARPTSQRTKHINIRYFSVRERINKHNIDINHLPTASMTADILTKPLQGSLFRSLRQQILNLRE
jgi:hypothetical protein